MDDLVVDKISYEAHPIADLQCLYSLFDVAMENNLCCLICQYVTNVCMDESDVTSDPVIAFLLDKVVVKDWRKLAKERKSPTIQRAWPEQVDYSMEPVRQDSFTLFLEDVLLNL
ncbi:hypothetical protein Nepgr_008761 [Nepenthes gracilis]|uniref:Uncharacterized protein n=1 Tax=Nepenthes gracilis TaxID=150966 RepID=A0AAD3SA80_NEPGR|nr:hypothetical protein Nepgr_008761 [Nepenthes gracilis]